jgi:hypothetical protein
VALAQVSTNAIDPSDRLPWKAMISARRMFALDAEQEVWGNFAARCCRAAANRRPRYAIAVTLYAAHSLLTDPAAFVKRLVFSAMAGWPSVSR